VCLHAYKHTVQNVAMTITTALEEAISRMQLQLYLLPVKRWRKRKSVGGKRHLQDAKKHARQISLDEVAGGGLANSRYQGATFFRPPFTLSAAFWLEMVCADGTGTRKDYLANHFDPKIEGHFRKNGTKIEK